MSESDFYYDAVKNKIQTSEKPTLEYLKMFFSGSDATKYGWTKQEAEQFIEMIEDRLNNLIPLSQLLMKNAKR